ncbi:MAG: glutathione S-transferase family protein [Gammaproteobacteria bacterium]|nr:glutathione S-transferase family protein [Gammaproteobacteria bacterium]
MIECYCAATTNSRKVLMMLEECGLAYQRRLVDLAGGEQRSAAYLALNPAGAVPLIIDADGPGGEPMTLAQSFAICLYLAEKSGRLLPGETRLRAEVLQWSAFGASDLAACTTGLYLLSRPGDEQQRGLAIMRDRLTRYLAVLDAQLAGSDFVTGDFSMADILIYPTLLAPFVVEVLRSGRAFNRIENWLKRMAERPAIARGM